MMIVDYEGQEPNLKLPATINGVSVTAISENAFAKNNVIVSVILPNSVTTVGAGAFDGCANLENIFVDSANTSFKSIDGVLYSFDEDNTLSITYKAATDKKTIVNLTNHSYFNLAGYGTIMDHTLWLDADKITLTDDELIPTGEELNVENTEFDFRAEKCIGKDIDNDNINLIYGQGYDHNYILNTDGSIKHFATLKDPKSGRVMKAYTNQPCVQIYTGNCVVTDYNPFKNGVKPVKRCGVCLETQHTPDAPNHPEFFSCELNPGELYDYTTVFKFEN
jgi:aldose 1-epimerase